MYLISANRKTGEDETESTCRFVIRIGPKNSFVQGISIYLKYSESRGPANSIDPDQPDYFDRGLHCLPLGWYCLGCSQVVKWIDSHFRISTEQVMVSEYVG